MTPKRHDPGPAAKPDPAEEPLDLLALWRTLAPSEATEQQAARLSAVIVARGRTVPGDHHATLLLAEGRDPAAWLDLADDLPGIVAGSGDNALSLELGVDIQGSCLFLSARYGAPWAHLMLFLQVAKNLSRLSNNRVFAQLGARLRIRSLRPGALVESLGALEAVERHIKQSKPTPRTAETPVTPPEATLPTFMTRLALRVLTKPPVPATERDMKALLERYSTLAEPFPLASMPDPDELVGALLAEFPWFSDMIEAIRADLMLAWRLGRLHWHLRPLLICGHSGVGKSRFVKRLCELAHIPMGQVFAAGSADNRALAGTARGWTSATPCLPLTVMLHHRTANPIIIVEEIDKAGGSDRNGRIADTLLTMTDSHLSKQWPDECLLVDADLSQITWILIANRRDRVPATLRARCRILEAAAPRPRDFDVILAGVLADLANEFDVAPAALPELPQESIEAMRQGFIRGSLQARQIAALVRRATAAAANAELQMARH